MLSEKSNYFWSRHLLQHLGNHSARGEQICGTPCDENRFLLMTDFARAGLEFLYLFPSEHRKPIGLRTWHKSHFITVMAVASQIPCSLSTLPTVEIWEPSSLEFWSCRSGSEGAKFVNTFVSHARSLDIRKCHNKKPMLNLRKRVSSHIVCVHTSKF